MVYRILYIVYRIWERRTWECVGVKDWGGYWICTSPCVSGGNTAYTAQTKQRVRDRESLHTHAAFRTREFVAYAPRSGVLNGSVADGVGRVRDG